MNVSAILRNYMLRTLFFTVLFMYVMPSFAQKAELTISINSGLFSFSGLSSRKTSILLNPKTSPAYTLNPYGSKSGLSYGLSGKVQWISKNNFIVGLDIGYELLKSSLSITTVTESFNSSNSNDYHPAKGHAFMNNSFINTFPHIGKRFIKKDNLFDLTTGIELGYCLKSTEKAHATINDGTAYSTSVDRKTIKTDIRPRIQLSMQHDKTGFFIGYSYGLSNYKAGYIGGTNECFSRLIRFGATYKIK
jgi:hypothetical protein